MSGYNTPHESNHDTFLSRVFGLHSVYNQLHENYQYYDPEPDSIALSRQPPDDEEAMIPDIHGDDERLLNKSSEPLIPPVSNNTLLDSESDSDFSSSPSPSIHDSGVKPRRKNAPSNNNDTSEVANVPAGSINWNTNKQFYNNDDEEDAPLSSLVAGPSSPRKLKFNIPNPRDLFYRKNATLPLYKEPPDLESSPAAAGPSFRKSRPVSIPAFKGKRHQKLIIPPKERALYLWANITNMDEFLSDIYYYYRGKGLQNIVLSRLVDLVILVFILSFSIFLKWGINYQMFHDHFKMESPVTLHDLIIPNFIIHEVPLPVKFLLLGFTGYIILRLIQLYFDYNYKLREIRNFYQHLIGLDNDSELMTISWKTIVERLMLLKDYNSLTSTNGPSGERGYNTVEHRNDLSSKVRLNAHDIANRIMRKENYMIALINKEVLDMSLSLPFKSISLVNSKAVLTKTLEWNLKLCINNFVFNQDGQINPNILKDHYRNQLSRELNSRFKMAAIINLILSPFIVIYFVLLYFFRYFNEYKSNPSSLLGLRQFTPYAHWKLREFNELPHFFIKRLNLSIGPANTYINQFPRPFLVVNIMYLINFVSGAIMAILVILGLWFEDEEHSFWSFEITEGKSSLFYISFFGTLWAVTTSSVDSPNAGTSTSDNANSNSSTFVYDPEASLRYVSQFTHYLPSSWNGRLHTIGVKNEFCDLYSLKIVIILNEILSLILTPFILWFKVSNNSSGIIDFFRDFSIHVDGLGYVCYYAMFNFEEKDKNMMYDLNKDKRKNDKKHRRSRSSKSPTVRSRKVNPKAGIELDNIGTTKAKLSDSEVSDRSDSSEESESDLNNNYQQDEKMIKSYMYFLESYGGTNANARIPASGSNPTPAKRNPTVYATGNAVQSQFDPSPSLMYQNKDAMNQSLSDSTYNINYKLDDSDRNEETSRGRKSGVLGMLNQFYKQDINRG